MSHKSRYLNEPVGAGSEVVDYPLCILKSFLSRRVVGSHRVMGTLQYSDKWSREQISKTFCQVNVFRSALFPRNTFHNVWLCCLVKKDIIFGCSGKEKAMVQLCKSTLRTFIINLQNLHPTIAHLFVRSFNHSFVYLCIRLLKQQHFKKKKSGVA